MMPWMNDREIALIEEYLTPSTIMLEWGSGGSTMHFSKLVKDYYSIEHDDKWYFKVLIDKPDNVKYYYQPPNILVHPNESSHQSHKDYIERAGKLNTQFDVVLIDGRARLACAIYIKKYLHKNSIVFIHDFWKRQRTRYRPVLDHYTEIESIKDTVQTIIVLKPNL